MKTTFRILAAGLAASLALVSCDKESLTKTDNGATKDGVRTITVSFADVTRSELNGFQPSFKEDDKIMVSNGSKSEECTVSIDKGVASITISDGDLKEAELTAVYPAAAWINSDPYFKVSTEQSGKFEDANICKATISAGSKDAVFENQTAIFRITPGAGAETKYVEVITAGPKIADFAPQSSSYTTMHKIHVASETADEVFVSILVPSGLKIRDLSFADGSNMKTAKDNTTAVASNYLYTVDNNNWSEPYVEVNGLKWATRNVGAESSADAGLYFAWGETTGHEVNDAKTAFKDGHSFSWTNTPFNGKNSSYNADTFNGLKDTVCPNGILALAYDAANVNWGGSWRMPTKDEYDTFVSGSGYQEGDPYYNNKNVSFRTAGWGDGASFSDYGGTYWSSTLESGGTAYYLVFSEGKVSTWGNSRYYGCPIRPISE